MLVPGARLEYTEIGDITEETKDENQIKGETTKQGSVPGFANIGKSLASELTSQAAMEENAAKQKKGEKEIFQGRNQRFSSGRSGERSWESSTYYEKIP